MELNAERISFPLSLSPEKLCKELHALGVVGALGGLLAHPGLSEGVVQMALQVLCVLLDPGTGKTVVPIGHPNS